ncbi:MAG: hypothetical protein O3B74_10445 [Proteobacteria bacterium]|nr:hypothetical protein [Pseudomonadota bacterium]
MLFSFNKILLLIAILVAVWYGFKLIGRLDRARKHKLSQAAGRGRRADPGRASPGPIDAEPIDLVRGEDGKTFVARDSDRRD